MKKSAAHRSALSAWRELKANGGIELNDRDDDFAERLRVALAADAPDLDTALARASAADFVDAFFRVAEPYIKMFSAILDYFKRAGATQGKAQWRIAIDKIPLDLQAFEEFIASWHSIPSELDIPAVDDRGMSAVRDALNAVGDEIETHALYFRSGGAKEINPEINHWLNAYNRGEYPELPPALQHQNVDPALRDAAAILQVAVEIMRRQWGNRETMIQSWHQHRQQDTRRDDGLHPVTLAGLETDYLIANTVFLISRFDQLAPRHKQIVSDSLTSAFGVYERRHHGIKVTIKDLESLLSLPIWRFRHELYAVWIATEIIAAADADGHDVELHAENGKLTFAARNAVLATIASTLPTVTLCGERRSPLKNPIGESRTDNVQPDYSLWRGVGAAEACGLVVEVKHYKKNAPLRFREALVDYARAHTSAEIVLVSHGPARSPLMPEDRALAPRCHVVGDLSAPNHAQRAQLAKLVRAFLGAPVKSRAAGGALRPVLVDISGSMRPVLTTRDFVALMTELAQGGAVALADTSLRATIAPDQYDAMIATMPHGGTDLSNVVRDLLQQHKELTILTDRDGADELSRHNVVSRRSQQLKAGSVEIVDIAR